MNSNECATMWPKKKQFLLIINFIINYEHSKHAHNLKKQSLSPWPAA